LLNLKQVADRLNVNERHIRRLVFERRIPYLKWGHLLRFDPIEIEQWLERARIGEDVESPTEGSARSEMSASWAQAIAQRAPRARCRRPA
jgi:excisionase family DNA binding protein